MTVGAETLSGPLLLRVAIAMPLGTGLATPVLIKPLLDGIISAFHAHDGNDERDIARRLAVRTGADSDVIAKLLRQRHSAVLGARRLLWQRGKGVQWNPADDRCVAVDVQTHELPGLEALSIHGEMSMGRTVSR